MGPATPRWAPSSALPASRRRYNLAFSPRINADQTARECEFIRDLGHDPRKMPARRAAHFPTQEGSTAIPAGPTEYSLGRNGGQKLS